MAPEKLESHRCFGGDQQRWRHRSEALDCDMKFSVYLPPQVAGGERRPVVYWLSGLTCTDENFTQKAGAQRVAAELGLVLVAPDTSPRGSVVPDAPDQAYDLGQGAGFYVNATLAPWSAHYRMYDYVVEELPALIESAFPVSDRRAISGHSMGGHGALVVALRNPERYRSVSAFSPIANPVACPWGQKAFTAYLGAERSEWRAYDTCELLREHGAAIPVLVDQGDADDFLEEQLRPEALQQAADRCGAPLELRLQRGYDHSYFFVASFIGDHLRFQARYLD